MLCSVLTLVHRILNFVELVALLFLIFTDLASRLGKDSSSIPEKRRLG